MNLFLSNASTFIHLPSVHQEFIYLFIFLLSELLGKVGRGRKVNMEDVFPFM